ncbi:MAG: hypothetical protein GY875_22770 [Gammaproteobacteria bacterium]|nr:hypothetical protein [Gammaproteobacteria bacterium]
MFTLIKPVFRVTFLSILLFVSAPASASGNKSYHVTITNLTHAIIFTPILVASHRRPVSIFELGTPASDELSAIAEGGDVGPLTTMLNGNSQVIDVQNSGGLLMPGQSVTVIVSAEHGAKMISIASMMLPTNDAFIGLNSVAVSRKGSTFYSPGYDAGSEANDELCINIPGGANCSGVGYSPGVNDGDENQVHVHRGTHGVGDLAADVYDWRNPVARITVTRVRGSRGH